MAPRYCVSRPAPRKLPDGSGESFRCAARIASLKLNVELTRPRLHRPPSFGGHEPVVELDEAPSSLLVVLVGLPAAHHASLRLKVSGKAAIAAASPPICARWSRTKPFRVVH